VTTPPVALTLAGSRSGAGAGAGAGIHDDLATLAAHGARAITAETVHDTTRVHGRPTLSATLVPAQALAALDDLPAAAVKTGHAARGRHRPPHGHLAAVGRLPTWSSTPSGSRLLETPDHFGGGQGVDAPCACPCGAGGPRRRRGGRAARVRGRRGPRRSARTRPRPSSRSDRRQSSEQLKRPEVSRGIEARIPQASSLERVTKQQMRVALEQQGGIARLLSACRCIRSGQGLRLLGMRLDYHHLGKRVTASAEQACVFDRVRRGT